jgi:hypothetical protein
MNGTIFVDWKPFDHPQLGEVEIGGWVSKLYDPSRGSYTSVMTTPGPVFEEFLLEHSTWNNWMASMSPLVRVTDVSRTDEGGGFYRVRAKVQNQGYLPTNVTDQAIRNRTAKTVKVSISTEGAELAFGDPTQDVGHLAGNRSEPTTVEWMVKATGSGTPRVVVTAMSEKGGTHSRSLNR